MCFLWGVFSIKSQTSDLFVNHFDGHFAFLKTLDFSFKEYLRRTKVFSDGHTQLLLSNLKPHLPISKDTLARWIRDVLHKAGVDTHFGAHSTRSASTSAATSKGLPIDIVLKAAGWSSASTFTRFYKREPVTHMGQTIFEAYFHQK